MLAHILSTVVVAVAAQGAPQGALHKPDAPLNGASYTGGDVTAQSDYTILVPNVICAGGGIADPFDGSLKTAFRPQLINLDGVTIRGVLNIFGVHIDSNTVVQAISVSKVTPYWKCTAFVQGPGSGKNTNFDTGWKYANSTMLDKPICALAFGVPVNKPCFSNRDLLFSPPDTTYTLQVCYVVRNPITGRTGVPIILPYIVRVKESDRAALECNIEYFTTVAAGVTQKPKIDTKCSGALLDALAIPDDLTALLSFETVVALYSIDFAVLREARNQNGDYDSRFITWYMVDDDEEPIGCLLLEMASSALWH